MDYADQFRRAIREVEDEQKKELEEVFSDAFKDSRVAFNTLCKFLSLNQFPLSREQIVTSIEDLTYSRDLLDEQHNQYMNIEGVTKSNFNYRKARMYVVSSKRVLERFLQEDS